jgi:hypothetical protein
LRGCSRIVLQKGPGGKQARRGRWSWIGIAWERGTWVKKLSSLFIVCIAKVARLVALFEHLCYNVAAQARPESVLLVCLDQQFSSALGATPRVQGTHPG